jgi:glycosyltransferase involved in cell wall biosynthesis
MPKVSVVIPTHNRPALIGRAIRSVLGQTYQDFEIIVVDDGVELRAEKELLSFADERIRYLQNEKSLGAPVSRNIGIKEARGDYIAFLDDDDEWDKTKLEKQVRALDAEEKVDVVFNGVIIRNKNGDTIDSRMIGKEGVFSFMEELIHKCFIWTSAFMIRAEVAKNGFGFDPEFKKNQEWDLLIRLSAKSPFYSINEALTFINILNEDEHLGGKGNIKNVITGFHQLVDKHIDLYRSRPKSLALRYFQLGLLYADDKQSKNSNKFFFKAFSTHPKLLYLKHCVLSVFGSRLYLLAKKSVSQRGSG